MKIEFFRQIFEKKIEYKISWKIHPEEDELFSVRTDGRMDMMKIPVAFRNLYGSSLRCIYYQTNHTYAV